MVNDHYPYYMAISLGIYPIFRQTSILDGMEKNVRRLKLSGEKPTSILRCEACWELAMGEVYSWANHLFLWSICHRYVERLPEGKMAFSLVVSNLFDQTMGLLPFFLNRSLLTDSDGRDLTRRFGISTAVDQLAAERLQYVRGA